MKDGGSPSKSGSVSPFPFLMRKLLNKPWVVGLLATTAVVLVAYEGLGLSANAASVQPGISGEEALVAEAEPAVEQVPQNLAAREMFVASGSRDPFAARPSAITADEKPLESPAVMETLKLAAVWLQGTDGF